MHVPVVFAPHPSAFQVRCTSTTSSSIARMQASRAYGASAASASGKARSASPLDGGSLPLGPLHGQLGNLSLNRAAASPAKGSSSSLHARSKSTVGSRASTSASPAKTSRHRPSKSVSETASKSARTSPVKPVKSGHAASTSKTPNRAAGSLGRSLGAGVKDTIAAGGLGRMDIAGKDWDAKSSSTASAGSSPQKKKLAASTKVMPATECEAATHADRSHSELRSLYTFSGELGQFGRRSGALEAAGSSQGGE